MKKNFACLLVLACLTGLLTGCAGRTAAMGAGQEYFNATVLQVHDRYLLVEPIADTELSDGDVRISTDGIPAEQIAALSIGDEIQVVCSDGLSQIMPVQMSGVSAVYPVSQLHQQP